MKRCITMGILLALACSLAPAKSGPAQNMDGTGRNRELDMGYYLSPVNNIRIDKDEERLLHRPAYFGLNADYHLFFTTSRLLDVGLRLGANFDTAYDVGFSFAPTGRITFADIGSFIISPGMNLGIPFGSYEDSSGSKKYFGGCYLGFNADLGFRLWLINDGDRLFGLSTGVKLGCPIPGLIFTPSVKSGFYTSVYLGVCYNFGGRGFDTHPAAPRAPRPESGSGRGNGREPQAELDL